MTGTASTSGNASTSNGVLNGVSSDAGEGVVNTTTAGTSAAASSSQKGDIHSPEIWQTDYAADSRTAADLLQEIVDRYKNAEDILKSDYPKADVAFKAIKVLLHVTDVNKPDYKPTDADGRPVYIKHGLLEIYTSIQQLAKQKDDSSFFWDAHPISQDIKNLAIRFKQELIDTGSLHRSYRMHEDKNKLMAQQEVLKEALTKDVEETLRNKDKTEQEKQAAELAAAKAIKEKEEAEKREKAAQLEKERIAREKQDAELEAEKAKVEKEEAEKREKEAKDKHATLMQNTTELTKTVQELNADVKAEREARKREEEAKIAAEEKRKQEKKLRKEAENKAKEETAAKEKLEQENKQLTAFNQELQGQIVIAANTAKLAHKTAYADAINYLVATFNKGGVQVTFDQEKQTIFILPATKVDAKDELSIMMTALLSDRSIEKQRQIAADPSATDVGSPKADLMVSLIQFMKQYSADKAILEDVIKQIIHWLMFDMMRFLHKKSILEIITEIKTAVTQVYQDISRTGLDMSESTHPVIKKINIFLTHVETTYQGERDTTYGKKIQGQDLSYHVIRAFYNLFIADNNYGFPYSQEAAEYFKFYYTHAKKQPLTDTQKNDSATKIVKPTELDDQVYTNTMSQSVKQLLNAALTNSSSAPVSTLSTAASRNAGRFGLMPPPVIYTDGPTTAVANNSNREDPAKVM